MMSSACSSRLRRRAFSRSSSFTRGSTTRALGPRFLEPSAARAPCSTSRRQAVSRDEYSPSRRRRAPISPSSLQRSASRTIRSLYSEVNLRRWALAGTSGSGSCCGTGPAAHTLPSESPVALRAPSGSEESETCVSLGEPFMGHHSSALYIKLKGSPCLTYVGTKGGFVCASSNISMSCRASFTTRRIAPASW